jgi:ribosomal protein S18 acetylase RimI-like enzyme
MDAHVATQLMHMSMLRLADFLFGSNDPISAKSVLSRLFVQPRNRFSYQFADIAEVNGKAAGLLLSYPGRTMQHLEIPMGGQMVEILGVVGFARFVRRSLPLVFRREAQADEYFINTLAVLPECQEAGIGTHLLIVAEEKAKAASLRKCSLSVETGNYRARSLYERLGYRVVHTTRLNRLERLIGYTGFYRMVKVIV